MGTNLERKQYLISCVSLLLLTAHLIVQAQNDYSEWRPIKWYIAFRKGVSNNRLDKSETELELGERKNASSLRASSIWRLGDHREIIISQELLEASISEQGTGRSVSDENLGTPQALQAARDVEGATKKTEYEDEEVESRKKGKKLIKKMLLPLLLMYKLKFLMLIPVLITALVLLAGSSGLAGFFFAVFATIMAAHIKEH